MSDADDADADALALFHPVRRDALLPFLDLDEDSEDSDGIYAEELEDGSFLLFTFQPFALFAETPAYAKIWLAQFGEALNDVHDDERGILFFPDTVEPEAQTYAAVVAEVGDEGVFVDLADADHEAAANAVAGIDPELLQALASQLLGAGPDGSTKPPTPFEIGKLLEGMQGHLLATMGIEAPGGATAPDDDDDDETAPREDETAEPKKPTI
ncbi:MAG: hypothetical protein QOI41_1679 [Myxococcales bacterium]|nr:hypothetical protein [Myxococcales bacterium]